MEEFESMTTSQLRESLIEAMTKSHGVYFTLGYLKGSYVGGFVQSLDNDRDYLVTQILRYRS
jgi:hypothetical protein